MPVDKRLWSRDEFLALAAESGVEATPRLLADWVQLGLLDHPRRRGLGRGKGTTTGWPENQWELWKALLMQRPRVRRIAALCNLPVGLWLYFGDDYVELPQVKRAMHTWAGAIHARGTADSRHLVQEFVAGIPGPKLSVARRKEVERLLVGVLLNGLGDRSVDQLRSRLTTLLEPPSHRGRRVRVATLQAHVELLMSRLEALRRLRRGDLPDALYSWARTLTHYGRANWAEKVGPPTLDSLVENVCLDLTTTIGMSLTVPDAFTADPDSLLNPEVWTEQQLTDRMTWRPKFSPLVFASGGHPMTGIEALHNVTRTSPTSGATDS
jgi:hypothetical protein